MENNRKSNKKFPFEGPNPYAIWSVNDSLEQLEEIKKILKEKSKMKWLIFYSTTAAMILLSFFLFYNVKELMFFIIPIIVFVYILYIQLTRLNRFKYLKIDLNSRIDQLEKRERNMEEEEHYKELLIRSEYASFFKEYVNDDWDRNNPFIDIIETEQNIFFSRSKHKLVYPLKSKISELPLTDKEIDYLKNLFKTDYDIVKEISLGKYLMNISWLKSYSEHQETKSPEVFYKWVFKINNKSQKTIMEMTLTVICRCGSSIPDENIDKWNSSNEEGEDYCVVIANCDNCSSEFETTQWGEWENLEEAREVLQEYISKITKSN